MILRGLFLGVLLPAAVSFVVLLAVVRPWSATPVGARRELACFAAAPSIAVAFVAADLAFAPQRPLRPIEAWQWLSAIALGALFIGLIEAWRARTGVVGWVLRAVLLGAAVWVMLAPLRQYEWEGAFVYLWPAATLVVLLLGWAVLDGWMRPSGQREQLLWLMVLPALSSVMLVLAGSKRLGDLGGALTAAVGACWVVTLWRPATPLAAGARVVAGAVLSGLIVNGWFFADIPIVSIALFGIGIVAPLLTRIRAMRSWVGMRAMVFRGALLIVPLLGAVAMAARAYFAEADEYAY
jgi:hypothetical protein